MGRSADWLEDGSEAFEEGIGPGISTTDSAMILNPPLFAYPLLTRDAESVPGMLERF